LNGITDYKFRRAFAHYFGGFDFAVAPFIAGKKDNRIRRVLCQRRPAGE